MRQLPPDSIQIPFSTYQNLFDHLTCHAATDGWAASLLKELEEEAKPVVTMPSRLSLQMANN